MQQQILYDHGQHYSCVMSILNMNCM